MTDINSILTLSKTKENLITVNDYLEKSTTHDLHYIKALVFKAEIIALTESPSDSIYLLETFIEKQNLSKSLTLILINSILNTSIEYNIFSKALEYINLKLDYLDNFNKAEYYLDLIRYYERTGDKTLLVRNILIYLEEDISYSVRYRLTKELVFLNIKENKFSEFLRQKDFLIDYSKTHGQERDLVRFNINYLVYLKTTKNYTKLIEAASTYLTYDYLSQDEKLEISSLLLDAYTNSSCLKEAILLESEYYDYLKEATSSVAILYARSALNLYKKLGNTISILDYEELLEKLTKDIEPLSTKKENIEVEYNPKRSKKKTKTRKIKVFRKTYRKEFNDLNLANIFEPFFIANKKVLDLPSDTKFRTVFRIFLTSVESTLQIKEVVILLSDFTGYHYKMGRVYDKTFDKDTALKTLNYLSLKDRLEIISNELLDKEIDIITSVPYKKNDNSLCLPFIVDGLSSSITFISDSDFLDESRYSLLVFTANLLFSYLKKEVLFNEQKNKTFELTYLEEENSIYLKRLDSNIVYLNKALSTLLKLPKELSLADFLNSLNDSIYKESFEDFLNSDTKKETLFFNYKDKVFRETIFRVNDDCLKYISNIVDITEYSKEINTLKDTSQKSSNGINSEKKLNRDVLEFSKTSNLVCALLRVIDLDFYEDIYGYKFKHDLIILIGTYLKEIVSTLMSTTLYLVDAEHYIILFENIKDIRTAKARVTKIIDLLLLRLNTRERRIVLEIDSSIYRIQKNSPYKNFNKPLMYLSKTLEFSKDKVKVFNKVDYEKLFFKEQLITHISECLDQDLLNINYLYVLDLENKSVPYYIATLQVVNFKASKEDLDFVIKKRDLYLKVDKYLIKNVLKEISRFYKETKKYIKVIIDVHLSSIINDNLIHYLSEEFSLNKLPKECLVLNVINDISSLKNYKTALNNQGYLISSTNSADILLNNTNIFLFDTTLFSDEYLNNYLEISNKLGITIVTVNINNKESYQKFSKYKCLISGAYFDSDMDLGSIIKKINNKKVA